MYFTHLLDLIFRQFFFKFQIDGFLVNDWKTGMTLDSYASSHPISQSVEHPKKIKEIFDSITYNKVNNFV